VEDVAGPRPYQRVVKRGTNVDKYQRYRKNSATHHEPRSAMRRCGDQGDRADDGQHRAYAVRDGIGQNVAKMVVVLHRMMIAPAVESSDKLDLDSVALVV